MNPGSGSRGRIAPRSVSRHGSAGGFEPLMDADEYECGSWFVVRGSWFVVRRARARARARARGRGR
ncbi:MAG: hypothetical protein ACKPHU_37945, partial [Planctomycetaceae bacterium]